MIATFWYCAIILLVGSAAAGRACATVPRWPRRTTFAGVLSAFVLVTLNAVRLWSQTNDAFGDAGALEWAQFRIVLSELPWGTGWRWQAGASVGAFIAMLLWRRRWRWWPLAAVTASAAAFSTAFTGHAVGMEDRVWITVLTHGLHVAAAGWWLGGLTVLLAVTNPEDYAGDPQARLSLGAAVDRFSPVALGAVSVLVVAGLIATWRHIGTLDGFSSAYGIALLFKIGAFAAAALCGLYNWRVLSPQLSSSGNAVRRLRALAWLEVSFGLLAIVITAALGTLSMPGHDH